MREVPHYFATNDRFPRIVSLCGLGSGVVRSMTVLVLAVRTVYHLTAADICTSLNLFQEMYSITEFGKTCNFISLNVYMGRDADLKVFTMTRRNRRGLKF
jgi:hypothetical protein